ncbi:hypothetical protein L1987_14057 [Smallanthus sonchifolius]|uniref:Uncharacterized protein n=1 Tax=Smallanthus sonchifolius TaxID=185202 RepID=A0ACB9JJT6_9ASTR|nr:hypothetical protein L1987_14057 [Smallanthus sonchifolius]
MGREGWTNITLFGFCRSIEHSRDNRRHICARTIHADLTIRDVQRETWMLDKLSTDVKYDMDESPSTTKIKLLMSMTGGHTIRTGNHKVAYRSWIGLCKHCLDRKLEGIAITSRPKHHMYKNRDSTGRKGKTEGDGF